MNLVPDSIEPIEGWKMLNLGPDGTLVSPNYDMTWYPASPVCALCKTDSYIQRWVLVDGPVPLETPGQAPSYVVAAGGMTFYQAPSPVTVPLPLVVPPPGKHWELHSFKNEHTAPGEGCSCGIYVARNIVTTAGYGTVLVKVKGWGNVHEHSGGWRVEYAYPSEIYVNTMEEALALEAYGVPIKLREDVKDQDIRKVLMVSDPTKAIQKVKAQGLLAGKVGMLICLFALCLNIVLFAIKPNIPGGIAMAIMALATGFLADQVRRNG